MTSEQIAAFTWTVHHGIGRTTDHDLVAALRNILPRLLDEREALLAALRAFLPFVDKRGACTAPQCLRTYVALADAYGMAQATITYAEQET